MGLVDDFLLLPDWIKLLVGFGILYTLGTIPSGIILFSFIPFLGAFGGTISQSVDTPQLGSFLDVLFRFAFSMIGINADYQLIVVLFALMLLLTFMGWMERNNR